MRVSTVALAVWMAACSTRSEDAARPAPASPLALRPKFSVSARTGAAPDVSDAPPGTNLAQRQLSQNAPVDLQEVLFARAAALPDIQVQESGISVAGARAFVLKAALGPPQAFMVGAEFAHLHPHDDGSLHMALPPALADVVYARGRGRPHPRSGTPFVYGPRDAEELELVWQLLLRSYLWAHEGRIEPLAAD